MNQRRKKNSLVEKPRFAAPNKEVFVHKIVDNTSETTNSNSKVFTLSYHLVGSISPLCSNPPAKPCLYKMFCLFGCFIRFAKV